MTPEARRRTWARARTAISLLSFDGARLCAEVQRSSAARLLSTTHDAPSAPLAMILGAPVPHGRVTAVLEDRLLTGAELLSSGKVAALLCTGTPREVEVMAAFLRERAVPEQALLRDPHGLHTFESIANAARAGHAQLLVVSQRFHLPRALYICRARGIEAWGVIADRRPYRSQRALERRERVSSVLAYWMCRASAP